MKIGELAAQCGCSVATIRFYEAEGLLKPAARTEGNYRSYDRSQSRRLAFVLRCRSLDLSHEQIRALLDAQDHPTRPCEPVLELLDGHLQQIDRRIADLVAQRAQLQAIRGSCGGGMSTGDCIALDSIRLSSCCGTQPARIVESIRPEC